MVRVAPLFALAFSSLAPHAIQAQPQQSVAMPADPAVDPNDKIRCRKVAVTGSLIKAEKVCKTVGEWRRLSERGNDVARAQWENGLICSGGPCRGIEPTGP